MKTKCDTGKVESDTTIINEQIYKYKMKMENEINENENISVSVLIELRNSDGILLDESSKILTELIGKLLKNKELLEEVSLKLF